MLDFGLVVLFGFVAGFPLLGALDFTVPVFALAGANLAEVVLLALVTGFALPVVVDLVPARFALLLTDADWEE